MNNNLDHLPTPQELAEIYMNTESNDPSSLYYKRKLVRPKFPIWRILLFFVLMPAICVSIYFLSAYILKGVLIPVLISIACLLILTLIFAKHIAITLVHIYQSVAPTSLRERCRYEPSCSQYMVLSLQKYGFWKGLKKGLKRWRACRPPNGGFDMP